MVRAVYNARNRPMIEARKLGFNFLELRLAPTGSPAPLHPGAEAFYTEARVLPTPRPAAAQR